MNQYVVYRLDEAGKTIGERAFETKAAAYEFFAGCNKDEWTGVFLRPKED